MPNREIKEMLGSMDLDSRIETIGKGFCQQVRNIVWYGLPPNRRAEIMPGNLLIPNSLLPITGTNKTINAKYDAVNKRIYFFNFNDGGQHGIYIFNTVLQTFQRLVQVGVNTNGDVLGFTPESLYNIDIIYGDSLQGDILCFTDSLGRPSKININRALTGGYGTIQRSFLDVAKEPPTIPPYAIYENDPANTVNNVRKKFFRFKERWVFDDHDKSVTSTQSEMPIPFAAFDQGIDADPTKNCRFALTYQTGPSNVKKIELLAAVSLGNVMSDFFLIASIDKSASSISDNDIATFLFYNNQAYNYIDVTESDQLFDYVPLKTISQCLPNGNVIDYGNITEGYPNLTNFSDGTNTSNIAGSQRPFYWGDLFSKLIANQGGESGFGTSGSNIHIVVRGIVLSLGGSLDVYSVYFSDNSNISYTLTLGDDASAIINGLRNDAISKGFTIVSVSSNDLYISKPGISLARSYVSSNFIYNTLDNTSFTALDWSSNHGWGLVYFDDKDRTNGVVYTSGFSLQSNPYSESDLPNDKPSVLAYIYHLPPDWAYSFQWVRTKDLSKQKLVQWMSDRTFKDATATSGLIKYAYISIESLRQFVLNNPGSPLGYSFSAGDRIKFFKRDNQDGTTANIYGNTKDFEVVASPIDPPVNGEVKVGQFIKIILPSTDGTFDFGTGFDNYFIEVYTPAQSVANNLNVYYEYGERYAIANPTTGARFHQGMLQNQIYGTQPATYEFTKGDYYTRLRAIQTGNIYKWNIVSGSLSNTNYFLFGLNFVGSTYTTAGITGNSVPIVPLTGSFNPSGDSRSFLNVTPHTDFKVSGTITLNFPTDLIGDTWSIFVRNIYGDFYTLVPSFDASKAGTYTFSITSVQYLGTISDTITLENDRVFLIAKSGIQTIFGGVTRPVNILSGDFEFTIDHVLNQRCIDPNFSDTYPSAVNSNGRAFIFDENANQVTFPVLHRWSLAYQSDTNVNQANRFYAENFDSLDRGNGALMRTSVWERMMTFFQERKIGQTGIYQKYITDSGGQNQLITTNNIITPNNVSYYSGQYGVANQATAVVQSGFVFYGVDDNKNVIWRLSRDGLTDLTEDYRVKSWAGANMPKYLNPGTYKFGGQQKILGCFNIRPDNVGEYLLLAQGTSLNAGETLGFEEKYNSFGSFYDIDCDYMVCAENDLYMFYNGNLWKRSTATQYSNYFGVQYTPFITLVFNETIGVKKVFNSVAYQSDKIWASPTKGDIYTNRINSQSGFIQQSLIMEANYATLEKPNIYASFNRDMNSGLDQWIALWEADYLTGNVIVCKFSYSGNTNSYFYMPYILHQIDQRNY